MKDVVPIEPILEDAKIDYAALGPAMPEGVYFGLPEDEYRAAGAVSSSLLKSLAVSPLTAWAEHIDPEREDESTTAQEIGRAMHTLVLEGEAVFGERFAILPTKDDDYLDGAEALKERCRELGLKVGGRIADLCDRILEADPDAKLWPVRMREFNAEHAGKVLLKPETFREMAIPARFVRNHPFAGKAFQGGCAEVSVFWTAEDGTPMKARADYLKVQALVDLKYFANVAGLPINKAVSRAIANEQHHLQARIYLDGVEAAKRHVKAGRVFGDKPEADWLEAFANSAPHRFFWVFIQKGRVPEVRGVEFRRVSSSEGSENAYWTHAERLFEDGRLMLRNVLATYGADPSVPWVAPEQIRALEDTDLPLWLFD